MEKLFVHVWDVVFSFCETWFSLDKFLFSIFFFLI